MRVRIPSATLILGLVALGRLAQLVEHPVYIRVVRGSNPLAATNVSNAEMVKLADTYA